MKEKCIAVIPTIAIAELLWKCRRKGKIDRVDKLLKGWKQSPNIIIEPFSLEILELMISNKDSYELHDEIIAMTCRKYNTILICTKDGKLIETYNLTKFRKEFKFKR
ncbi:MAG: type II toxin-antitoxin system VapC family toxin [Methanosarcinales archaeon]